MRAAATTIVRYPVIRSPSSGPLTNAADSSSSRRKPVSGSSCAASWRFPIGVIKVDRGSAAWRRSRGTGSAAVRSERIIDLGRKSSEEV